MQKVLALDLEFNQPSGRIVQIGAAMGCLSTLVIERTFECLVNPGELLSPEISRLTGISAQALMDEGKELGDAYQSLLDFAKCDEMFLNPVTWGNNDGDELRLQLELPLEGWFLGRRCVDVKTLHTANCLAALRPTRGGLAKCLMQYGLRFEGRKHNAKDDAVNTLRLFFQMVKSMRSGVRLNDYRVTGSRDGS